MYLYSYPNVENEKELPFYVVGVGINEWQHPVIWEKGYYHPQIIYCTKGEGRLIVDGHTYTILPNDSFYLPAFVPHEYYAVGPVWDTHWIAMDGKALPSTLEHLNLNRPEIYHLSDVSILNSYIMKIYTTSRGNQPFRGYYNSCLLYEFIIEYYRIINQKNKIDNLTTNTIISSAIQYIDENFRSNINLKELCNINSVTPQHLCRLFRKYLNLRPTEYINMIRMQEAKTLLLYSDLSINEISKNIGFSSCNYFCEMFKRYESITPSEYRKAN